MCQHLFVTAKSDYQCAVIRGLFAGGRARVIVTGCYARRGPKRSRAFRVSLVWAMLIRQLNSTCPTRLPTVHLDDRADRSVHSRTRVPEVQDGATAAVYCIVLQRACTERAADEVVRLFDQAVTEGSPRSF